MPLLTWIMFVILLFVVVDIPTVTVVIVYRSYSAGENSKTNQTAVPPLHASKGDDAPSTPSADGIKKGCFKPTNWTIYPALLKILPWDQKTCAALLTTAITTLAIVYLCVHPCQKCRDMTRKVSTKFENPTPPPLIREGDHFPRGDEDVIRNAFLKKTDTLGLVGVVFGPAGTGKSNVVRTVCRKKCDGQRVIGESGVIYMEIGSPRQFPYHLAKACGVPVEPDWLDTIVSKLFSAWKTHIAILPKDEDSLALILPVIADGGKLYKEEHNRCIPVLFIDGVDILAKQKDPADQKLYTNLVDWAKKCANEDSLRIVFVCSDSHVLALDQQSFKSRLDDLIEIDDVDETEAMELMEDKYGFSRNLARSICEIIGGRLADIHKVVSIWRNKIAKSHANFVSEVVVPRTVVNAVKEIRLEQVELLQTVILDTLSKTPEQDKVDKSDAILDPDKRELVREIIRTNNFRLSWKMAIDKVVISQVVVDAIKTAKPVYLQTVVLDTLRNIRLEVEQPDKSDDIKDAAMKERTRDTIRAIVPQEVVNAVERPAQQLLIVVQEAIENEIQNTNEDKSEDIQDSSRRELVRTIIRRRRRKCNCKVIVPQEVAEAVNKAQDLQTVILNALQNGIQSPNEDKSDQIKDAVLKERIRDIIGTYNFSEEIKEQFKREMRQALCKALGKDKDKEKKYIIKEVLEMSETKKWKTVEDIALQDSSQLQRVMDAIHEFLSNNVLRITKHRTLLCYNKMAKTVLQEFISGHAESLAKNTPKVGLSPKYKDILSTDEWLDDEIINAAQSLLKKQFSHIHGLQDTNLGSTLTFDIMRKEFVQILFTGEDHWLTVSTFGLQSSFIHVLDSLHSTLSSSAKDQICALLNTDQDTINVQFVNTEKQTNTNDCGLYAIAYATSVCLGENVSQLKYHSKEMRPHLKHCLETGTMTTFPSSQREQEPLLCDPELIYVHCYCRKTEVGNMITCCNCKKRFHYECVNSKKNLRSWQCKNCTS